MMHKRKKGFTLVELVGVMIIIGILAVIALPRFFNSSDFDSRAFSDQTLAVLRYAQKAAVAQRRTVCVAFSAANAFPATITLTISSAFGGACDSGLTGPNGATPYRVIDRSGKLFFSSAAPAAYPGNFSFNPLGQASIGQIIQVGGASNRITIVQETGYVY
ncbi:MAG TPA: type II secretion system protein [Noviherbaspirillum sp.]|nr:type II secretion system protein [Noviherbaspirillum sp.]